MDKSLMKKICEHVPDVRPEGFGVTAPELAKEKGISPHYARKVLLELEGAGMLEQRKMLHGKSLVTVFCEVKKK